MTVPRIAAAALLAWTVASVTMTPVHANDAVQGLVRGLIELGVRQAVREGTRSGTASLLRRCLEARDSRRVVGLCTDVLRRKLSREHNAAAFFHRGYHRFLMSDYRRAERDFSKAIQYGTRTSAVYFNRGETRRRLGRLAQARRDLERAARLGNRNAGRQLALIPGTEPRRPRSEPRQNARSGASRRSAAVQRTSAKRRSGFCSVWRRGAFVEEEACQRVTTCIVGAPDGRCDAVHTWPSGNRTALGIRRGRIVTINGREARTQTVAAVPCALNTASGNTFCFGADPLAPPPAVAAVQDGKAGRDGPADAVTFIPDARDDPGVRADEGDRADTGARADTGPSNGTDGRTSASASTNAQAPDGGSVDANLRRAPDGRAAAPAESQHAAVTADAAADLAPADIDDLIVRAMLFMERAGAADTPAGKIVQAIGRRAFDRPAGFTVRPDEKAGIAFCVIHQDSADKATLMETAASEPYCAPYWAILAKAGGYSSTLRRRIVQDAVNEATKRQNE